MEQENPLYDKLHIDYMHLKLLEVRSGFAFVKDCKIMTQIYTMIKPLDEVHFISLNDMKKEIKRFSFYECKEYAEYKEKQEITIKDITGYKIVDDSAKVLTLKNKEGFYTYLEYNINSRFYMLTLVPPCLHEAHPFDAEFKDYAKVAFKNDLGIEEKGYIYREDFIARQKSQIKLYSKEEIQNKNLMKNRSKIF